MSGHFLEIGGENISLSDALSYLQETGDLNLFLLKIIRQHLTRINLEALKISGEYDVEDELLEQAIAEFNITSQTNESFDTLESWLINQGISREDFKKNIADKIRIDRLKKNIARSQLELLFEKDPQSFRSINISKILVKDENLAMELLRKVQANEFSFESAVQKYSFTSDSSNFGQSEDIYLGHISETIRCLISAAQPGQIVGPLEVDGYHAIVRLNYTSPAILDEKLIEEFQEEVFDKWLQEQAQSVPIVMNAQ